MTVFRWFHRSFAVVWVALAANLFLPGLGLSQSLDELHKLAVKEGGTLNFYATLAQINAEKILPVFEKRFPGIKVNHVDATSDKLVARAVTEARGGKTLGDVLQVPLENVSQAHDQELLLEVTLAGIGGISAGNEGKLLGGLRSSIYHCGLEHRPGKERRRAKAIRGLRRSRAGKTA